ncbi:iron(III) transport system permease protein [Kribbella orskensis]|uniref:Iron(III) transport system permease protein n=1 Tax=Kribbella orskensis TaxID=2512216 RepID=A0ABY2BQ61_9ACTN|nr:MULTISPECIES: iron ABC transporter permease [Kribbella]TCN41792.1 iron(III) transport system permease protein [Kribbella sp. VKM Ac-2500]TCO25670.1 iron(III) transport system permease protein [Kribbella orskensis]
MPEFSEPAGAAVRYDGPALAPPVVRSRRSTRTPWLVVVAALLVAVLMVAPVLVVFGQATAAGAAEASRLLFRPRTAELLRNTLVLLLLTVPVTVVLGCGAAWLVERTTLPAAGVWRTLLLTPLAIPAFVSSYAWTSVLPSIQGLGGAVFVTALAYYPFVFLPAAALLRALDQGHLDAARSLGASGPGAVLRVVVPQLRPAVAGGALLVALHLLAEFGVLQMMRFPTFTTAILQQFAVGFSNAAGSLLAAVLVVLCLGLLALEVPLRGRARIARLGPGARQRPVAHRLGVLTIPALGALAALIGLAVMVPAVIVLRWLVRAIRTGAVEAGPLLAATGSSIGLAALAGLVATLAALPGAWLLHRYPSRLAASLERVTYVASALPGVVIGLALVSLAVQWARPVYQTAALAVAAYTILFLPRAMVAWRSGLAAAPTELSEASRSLGVSGPGTFARVVLPLVLPSALSGFVLVFLATVTELTATLLLAPTGTETLATAFWSASDELDYVASAPYAAAMIALSVPLTLLLRRQILDQR